MVFFTTKAQRKGWGNLPLIFETGWMMLRMREFTACAGMTAVKHSDNL